MALLPDIYRALEDVVGAENISEEPAILDSYAYQLYAELMSAEKDDRFMDRPEAVVLPASTQEVQAIVKTCNRYKVKFKAYSTGWGMWGGPGSKGIVQIDLRRMDRILEINEKNMYAVVEPYVIGARLQAELMKRSLNCQIIMGGANVSAFPLTALMGDGYTSVSTSVHGRNVLGVEWVLPTGEILQLGSVGSGAGWFCGDGPGPSLRGLLRGSKIGLGVFTKAATKVYHWSGPAVPPDRIEGVSPHYRSNPLLLMHIYYPTFPTWDKLAEAGIKIAESEIANLLCSLPMAQIAADIATSNEEEVKLFKDVLEATKGRPGLLVIISAESQLEFDYKQKVLEKILSETGGQYLHLLENASRQGAMTWRFARLSATTRQMFRATGASLGLTAMSNWAILPGMRGFVNKEATSKYIEKGLIFDDGGDGGYNTTIEYGHIGQNALGARYDPANSESRIAALEIILAFSKIGLDNYNYIIPAQTDAAVHEVIGPLLSNYHLWQRKVKGVFDPNITSDPTNYIDAKPPSTLPSIHK